MKPGRRRAVVGLAVLGASVALFMAWALRRDAMVADPASTHAAPTSTPGGTATSLRDADVDGREPTAATEPPRVEVGSAPTEPAAADPDSFLLRMVGIDDRPLAGVPVTLEVALPRPDAKPDGPRATTDAEGVARVATLFVDRLERVGVPRQAWRWRWRADVLAQAPAVLELSGPPEPGVVHTLRVPFGGSLVCDLVDEQGAPMTMETTVVFRWHLAGSTSGRPLTRHQTRATKTGRIVFAPLEGGLVGEVSGYTGRMEALTVERASVSIPGDGQPAHARLVFARQPSYSGRLVDERGAAVPADGLQFRVAGQPVHLEPMADGGFRFWTGALRNASTPERELEVTRADARNWKHVVERATGTIPAGSETRQENDLGTLVMRAVAPWSTIVTGRVIARTGTMPPEVQVTLTLVGKRKEAAPDDREPLRYRVTHSSPKGSFEIKSDEAIAECEIVAHAQGYVSSGKIPITVGACDVVIPLDVGHRVDGEVLLDLVVLPEELEACIGLASGGSWNLGIVAGKFLGDGLPRDPTRVSIRVHSSQYPIVEIAGVVPGQCDARLHPLDLRGKLRRISLRVVDATGQPVPDVAVRVACGKFQHAQKRTSTEGWVGFLWPTVEARATVVVADNQPQTLDVVADRLEVVAVRKP